MLPFFLEGRFVEDKPDAHGTVMEGNSPEPAIWNRAVSDSALGCEGHSTRSLPVSPNGNILECFVIVPILQVARGHDARSPGGIDEVIERYLTCSTASIPLDELGSYGPGSTAWPLSIK